MTIENYIKYSEFFYNRNLNFDLNIISKDFHKNVISNLKILLRLPVSLNLIKKIEKLFDDFLLRHNLNIKYDIIIYKGVIYVEGTNNIDCVFLEMLDNRFN